MDQAVTLLLACVQMHAVLEKRGTPRSLLDMLAEAFGPKRALYLEVVEQALKIEAQNKWWKQNGR